MLFGGRNKVKPKQFVYHPRYYKPEKDGDRRERMQFTPARRRSAPASKTRSPLLFLLIIIILSMIIWALNPNKFSVNNIDPIELDSSDIPVEASTP